MEVQPFKKEGDRVTGQNPQERFRKIRRPGWTSQVNLQRPHL